MATNHGVPTRLTLTYLAENKKGEMYGLAADASGDIVYVPPIIITGAVEQNYPPEVGDGFTAFICVPPRAAREDALRPHLTPRSACMPVIWDGLVEEADELPASTQGALMRHLDTIDTALEQVYALLEVTAPE